MKARTHFFSLLAGIFLISTACSDGHVDDDPDGGASDGGADADGDSDSDGDGDGGADGGEDAGMGGCVETAAGALPGDATVLSWDDDAFLGPMTDATWNPIEGLTGSYVLGEEPMWEAVRFDLHSPATVLGVRVRWGNLTGDGWRPVRLGVYDDFGSNGFDFYQWESRWEGDRCLTPETSEGWVEYVLDEPLTYSLPGPVFVAHFWESDEEPLFLMSEEANDCDGYDACHSAVNLPHADETQYYNGISLGFPYDFGVRLVVELHDDIGADEKWFQEDEALTASRRVAWGDYDNDGDDDLMTNGPVLYRNDGDGSFTDVTDQAGLDEVTAPSGGGVFGDFDNDGWLDYFGLGDGQAGWDILLRNLGDGTFEDVTEASGISDLISDVDCVEDLDDEYAPTQGNAWVDLDADGFLDLYLAEYQCGALGVDYVDRIFHNEGDGTFTEWGTDQGFSHLRQAGRGVSPADFDLDGDVDVFVSNYRLDPNFLFVNDGDGGFSEEAEERGVVGEWISGYYGHTIGSVWLDADLDGDLDLFQANLAHPRFYDFSDKSMLLLNDGTGHFEDGSEAAGIHYRETHSNPTSADFDLDGAPDLFVTCVYDGRFSEMYLGDGEGGFRQVNYESGAIVYNGWGSAASDFDLDGDVDLVAGVLLRNDSAAGDNHWLQVRALGGASSEGPVNGAGIGAVVTVRSGDRVLVNHVSGGSGTTSQDSAVLVFGLGEAEEADEIEVLYPGGAVVTVEGPVAADQRVWIRADGEVEHGFAHPWTP